MADIRLDYDLAREQHQTVTDQFDFQDERIKNIIQEIQALESERLWIGSGASAFYGEMAETVMPSYRAVVDSLALIANSLNSSCNCHVQCEEDVIPRFGNDSNLA